MPAAGRPAQSIPAVDVTPRALTRDRILFAGLGVVEERGLDALDLATVARALHVLPRTLQRFMREEEIRSVVIDDIFGRLPTVSVGRNWRWRLESWARRMRRWLLEYPGLPGYLEAVHLERDETLGLLDAIVGLLQEAGVADDELFYLASSFLCFVCQRVDGERQMGLQLGDGGPGSPSGDDAWTRLPSNLAEPVSAYASKDAETHFNTGIRVVLDGIGRQGRRSRTRGSGGS